MCQASHLTASSNGSLFKGINDEIKKDFFAPPEVFVSFNRKLNFTTTKTHFL